MPRRIPGWTLAVSSLAIFMVSLDNLVVTNALTSIREDLGASLEGLEWTVNAYTLAFAVFLLTGAALGDRFGRRRMFLVGLAIFTGASAAAALAPSTGALIGARALQGLGAAILAPLSLTLLSTAAPVEKRGLALGVWSGVSGLGVALGPLVGGAVIEGISWQWIFWLNVPVGLVLAPLAARRLGESHGPASRLDLPGLALASAGLLGVVYGVVRGNPAGWGSTEVVASIAAGAALLAGFVAWELRARAPMLPLRFFRSRQFAATNGVSLAMTFGIFGSIFLLAQFFQTVQGYSPLEAGLRTLPWTGMPMIVAPIAGILSDRAGLAPADGGRPVPPGDRDHVDRGRVGARRGLRPARARRSCWAARAWRSCSRPPRTRCSARCGRRRPARPPAPTTRSASSAACWAWPCSPPCSPAPAASRPRRRSSTGSCRRCGPAPAVLVAGGLIALLIPGKAAAAHVAAVPAVASLPEPAAA